MRRVTSGAKHFDQPSDSVDVILSNAVLEHLENHPKAFSEFFRVTKARGLGFPQVDFRDHRSFERPLEHLLMSREKFERVAIECFRERGTSLPPNLFASPEYFEDFVRRLRKAHCSRTAIARRRFGCYPIFCRSQPNKRPNEAGEVS